MIEANSVIKLSSSTQGTLARVDIVRGDRVKAGQIVAHLDSEVEETMHSAARLKAEDGAAIRAREADLQNAERKFDRIRQLASKDYASAQSLDEVRAAAAVARAALDLAKLDQQLAAAEASRLKALIERRNVRSPVNGVVVKLDLHAGEFADVNNSIATISESDPLRIEVYLPVEAYPLLRIGMRAEIKPQEPIGGSYTALVVSKDPHIDSASGTFQLSLRLPNAEGAIPSGLRCGIKFIDE